MKEEKWRLDWEKILAKYISDKRHIKIYNNHINKKKDGHLNRKMCDRLKEIVSK